MVQWVGQWVTFGVLVLAVLVVAFTLTARLLDKPWLALLGAPWMRRGCAVASRWIRG